MSTSLEDRYQALPDFPKTKGTVQQLGFRPEPGVHVAADLIELSPAGGVHGDRWARGSWVQLPDGSPDPRVQVAVTNSHILSMIAGSLKAARECGDNLFVDLDLSEANLPVGARIQVGEAVLEVSDIINDACGKFIQRFGQEAFDWIRDPANAPLRLRGLFCKVIQAGEIRIGDTVKKL